MISSLCRLRAANSARLFCSKQLQHPIAVVGTGRAVRPAGDDGRAGIERRLEPVVICESAGTQAEDAQAMQRMYEAARG